MNLKDKPVYPIIIPEGFDYAPKGLTYREWLIGMLMSNPKLINYSVKSIIEQADAIIKEIEESEQRN